MTTKTMPLSHTAAETTVIDHFINGAETAGEGDRTKTVYNPTTGAVCRQLRLANRAGPATHHASGASYNFPAD